LLLVQNVTKDFGGLRALDGVDLEIERGEIVGLIGPNGSGKTTLFNVVTGTYKPTSGKVIFDGQDITDLPAHRTSRLGVARTFQQICLFEDLPVKENVIAGLVGKRGRTVIDHFRPSQRHDLRAAELLSYVGLEGKGHLRAGALPYGDQRRLEMARALATDPRLLLLDEPLAGMNPAEIADFLDLVHQVNAAGVSILLIEHNVSAVTSCCKTTYVFNYGRRIACGPGEELVCDEAVIKAYIGSETTDVAIGRAVQDTTRDFREFDRA
jgi:branched-chain amino acid transport system ATP-binding protein